MNRCRYISLGTGATGKFYSEPEPESEPEVLPGSRTRAAESMGFHRTPANFRLFFGGVVYKFGLL